MTEIRCRAVLFDLDGVLVDSTARVEYHWRVWAEQRGLDVDALLQVVHGRRAIDTIRSFAPHLDAEAELQAIVAAEVGDTRGLAALPGAEATLAALPPTRLAIVTSGSRSIALARLRAAGLPIPRVMVAADEIERGKPDPQGYLRAATALGVPPEDCIVVEDAPAGAAAARAAGMRLIAITTTHDPSSLPGAVLAVPNLAALRVVLSEHDLEGGPTITFEFQPGATARKQTDG
jgi:sugar-phosphatase